MRVGLRSLDLDRVAPGRLLFHHWPCQPGPLPLLLLKAEPGTPSQGFFSASSSFLATSSPPSGAAGPPGLAARAPPVVVTPQLCPPVLSGARSPPWLTCVPCAHLCLCPHLCIPVCPVLTCVPALICAHLCALYSPVSLPSPALTCVHLCAVPSPACPVLTCVPALTYAPAGGSPAAAGCAAPHWQLCPFPVLWPLLSFPKLLAY